MKQKDKILIRVLNGRFDKTVKFKELCNLLTNLGFNLRVKGSHYIFYKSNILEIINIQSIGQFAKAYQVKQIRELIIKYNLENGET